MTRETRLRGYHWHGQGIAVRRSLGDVDRFLDAAVALTCLTELSRASDPESGIGYALIAESHVSVHIREGRAWADVFSCRKFRSTDAERAALNVFGGRWRGFLMRRDI